MKNKESFRIVAGLMVFSLLLLGCASVSPHLEITASSGMGSGHELHTLNSWYPDLEQAIEEVEAVLATQQKQQFMNYTSANLATLYDARLYITFDKYIDMLPQGKKASAIAQQLEFLRHRKKITSEIYDSYDGGTGASYASAMKGIELTNQHIILIEALIRKHQ